MTALTVVVVGLLVFTSLFTGAALLPLAHGFSRGSEFPRQQLAVVAALGGGLGLVVGGTLGVVAAVLQGLMLLLHIVWISRFTPVWPAQAREATDAEQDRVKLLVSNVKMSNRAYDRVLALVAKEQPDLVLLVEVDEEWAKGVSSLEQTYPQVVSQPQDNGYGILLFSRLPLDEIVVEELLVTRVPSVRARVRLASGATFRLYGIHPEPPTPHGDSIGRDAELGLVAKLVAADPLPCIVTGDLNDVGWSSTTRRFQRISGLLDPRVGRGFYNSFHVDWWMFRWPLDHLFHDEGFAVVSMDRLPSVGSDHFPMLFELAWTGGEGLRSVEEATPEDLEVVDELVATEQARDRDPIGEDWESSGV